MAGLPFHRLTVAMAETAGLDSECIADRDYDARYLEVNTMWGGCQVAADQLAYPANPEMGSFKDCFSQHSDLGRRENRFLGLMSTWKLVFMPA